MGELAAIHQGEDPLIDLTVGLFRDKHYVILKTQGQTLIFDDPVWCDAFEDALSQIREWL